MVTGKEGWAAPRLKDAVVSESKMRECYFEVSMIRYSLDLLRRGHLSKKACCVFWRISNIHLVVVSVRYCIDPCNEKFTM